MTMIRRYLDNLFDDDATLTTGFLAILVSHTLTFPSLPPLTFHKRFFSKLARIGIAKIGQMSQWWMICSIVSCKCIKKSFLKHRHSDIETHRDTPSPLSHWKQLWIDQVLQVQQVQRLSHRPRRCNSPPEILFETRAWENVCWQDKRRRFDDANCDSRSQNH